VVLYLCSVLSAFGLGWAAVLQHRQARRQPAGLLLTPRLVQRLALDPRWLAGLAVEVAAVGAEAIALRVGPVATVQAIKTSTIVFAVLLARRRHDLIDGLIMALLVGGMAAYLIVAQPTGSERAVAAGRWLVALAIVMIVVAACLAASREAAASQRALALGVAAGSIWALTAVLLKASVATVERHHLRGLLNWPPGALVLAGLVGMVINQSAFQAGELVWSLPAITVVEPLLGTVLGIIVYRERLHANTAAAHVVLWAGAACALAGAVVLSRRSARQGDMAPGADTI